MNIKVKHIIIVFALLIISIALSLSGNYLSIEKEKSIDLERIETILNKKSSTIENQLNFISKKILLDKVKTRDFFYNESKDIFKNKGVGYFYYHKNVLKYWTTNNIPLPKTTKLNFFERPLIHLNNGWYICKTVNGKDWHLVGLFQLKKEYSYKNDILKNSFYSDLKIDAEAVISLDSTLNSTKICLQEDTSNNCFYLTNPEQDVNSSQSFGYTHLLRVSNVFLGLILLLFIFIYWVNKKPKYSALISLSLLIILYTSRFLMLKYGFFKSFDVFELFSPILFAESFAMPSLGELLVNSIFFMFFSIYFVIYFRPNINIKATKFTKIVFSLTMSIIMFIFSGYISNLFYSLVWNSSISFEFENVLNLDIYSFIGTLVVLIVSGGILLIVYRLLYNFKTIISFPITTIFLAILFIYSFFNKHALSESTETLIIFNVLFFFLWFILIYVTIKRELNYFFSVLLLIVLSLVTSEHFSRFSNQKEEDVYKVVTYNLAVERDVGAEFFLKQTYNEIKSSEGLNNAILEKDFKEIQSTVNGILLSKRYFNKYEVQVTVCQCEDSLLIEPDFINVECFEFFKDQIDEYGIIIPGSNFYFLDNHNGRISYLGELSSKLQDASVINIYIELNSKIFSEGLGYPELLLDKKLTVKETLSDYNYAKYNKGNLISSKGDYKYRFNLNPEENDTAQYSYYEKNDYIHFKYRPDKDNIIILSKPNTQYSSEIVSFTYILFFLFIVFNILLLIIKINKEQRLNLSSLKVKIQISFITILILSLILTGTISIYFIIEGYKDKQKQTVLDKVNSVLIELEQNVGTKKEFNYTDTQFLNSLLVKYSNVFYTDINIYDLNGLLLSSSRIELYDKGLKGRYMDSRAYKDLIINKGGTVIITEEIDNITYLSAYIPFRNYDNKVIAYLNLPYFAKQSEFKEEISNFVIAFSNIFLALTLMAVVVGVFIARQLTRPLVLIQDKIKAMDIKKKAEKIVYNKNDELGGLIREYNRKVDELSESANKLAQSERETAWREMAKQIAHEIKNPLTPMKLSVQYLERAYDKKDENWEATYRKVSKNLIEQIDVLSGIASEFSNFAKMPASKKEAISLIDLINNTVSLYDNLYEVKFYTEFNINSKGLINADKEQMVRVFNNLIKNSIQAIPDHREGKIIITVNENEKTYIVKVIDNGNGIPEAMQVKIFQPNFTTKSSGMGLGLSMVKNMLISNNATIRFETEENVGTEFIMEIPIYL